MISIKLQNLFEHPGTDTSGAVVEGADLSGGEGALGLLEGDRDEVLSDGCDFGGFGTGSVARLDEAVKGCGEVCAEAREGADLPYCGVESLCVGLVVANDELVGGEVLAHHDIGDASFRGGDAMSLALPEGVEVEPSVLSHNLAVCSHDVAGFIGNVVGEKVAHLNVTDETNALAVLLLRGGEAEFF